MPESLSTLSPLAKSGFHPGVSRAMRQAMKIRLAQSADEIRMAQRLRYHVFHEEYGARLQGQHGLDADRFDPASEHLLVIDAEAPIKADFALEDGALVGTYRLISQAKAQTLGGFYSQSEFDLAPLLDRKRQLRFLELGRSCVLKQARGTAVIELLWQGIWDYVRQNHIDVMLGCASFEGTDPQAHAAALSFLAQHATAEGDWHVRAKRERFQEMNLLPLGSYDVRRAAVNLPPLIKGYWRLGCRFGQGCVIDADFNSVDVLVVLPVSFINPRYFARFGAPT
jgi:L-ornithine Nalpha-acyltransferase